MADTGAPWNLPYPLPTDLVRDGADAIKDLAEATADGLDAAGGLVAVKHVLKTDPFTASVTAGNSVAVSGTNALTITHALADASNRLIISAFFGVAATSFQTGAVGIAVSDGTSLLAIGDADGARTRVSAGGTVTTGTGTTAVAMPAITFVHAPGTTASITYTVHAINIRTDTRTLYVNRSEADFNDASRSRGVSALVIQEVKV